MRLNIRFFKNEEATVLLMLMVLSSNAVLLSVEGAIVGVGVATLIFLSAESVN